MKSKQFLNLLEIVKYNKHKMMKLFYCIVLVFCALKSSRADDPYPPPELYEIITPLHELCTGRIGVSDDEVKNYKITDNSDKMMCYMECLMKESKWMSPDGEIQYSVIKEFAHPKVREIILAAIGNCMEIDRGTKNCELSYNFNVCLQKADPVHWFLP